MQWPRTGSSPTCHLLLPLWVAEPLDLLAMGQYPRAPEASSCPRYSLRRPIARSGSSSLAHTHTRTHTDTHTHTHTHTHAHTHTHEKKVALVTNVACACGLTNSNYKELVALHKKYADQGLVIMAFPCNQVGSGRSGARSGGGACPPAQVLRGLLAPAQRACALSTRHGPRRPPPPPPPPPPQFGAQESGSPQQIRE